MNLLCHYRGREGGWEGGEGGRGGMTVIHIEEISLYLCT